MYGYLVSHNATNVWIAYMSNTANVKINLSQNATSVKIASI